MDKLDFIIARQTIMMKAMLDLIPSDKKLLKLVREWNSIN